MRKNLTKREIVKKKSDIDAIFRTGTSYSSNGVRLILAPNGGDTNRVIIIPIKHYGSSVERNRIRRQCREIWRLEKHLFCTGFDFAFVVYPRKAESYETRKKKLTHLFLQAGVYKPA